MTGNSRRARRAACGRASPLATCRHREWITRNVGRTGSDFQCRLAAINRLLSRAPAGGPGSRIVDEIACRVPAAMREQKGNNVKCPSLGQLAADLGDLNGK